MTALIPSQDGELRRLISAGKISIDELLDRLAPPAEPPAPAEVEKPKQIILSPEDKTILRTLPKALADIELPADARALTQDERNSLVPVFDRVKIAKSAVVKAEEAIKEAMHNDIDATTVGDLGKNGHKLSEGEVVADGYAKKAVRGLVGGNAVSLVDLDLQQLEEEGLITHAQYLKMTSVVPATRKPSAEGIMAEINKDPKLLDAIATKARRTDQTTAIRMAKA
jgi:hypothetical protein